MTKELIPLTKSQKEVMHEFYGISPTKVLLKKKERDEIWKVAVKHGELDFAALKKICPALEHRIRLAYFPNEYETERNIQSAVFSECVYAQTYANMLGLNIFVNCYEVHDFICDRVLNLLKSYNLVPRYVYSTQDRQRMLIQAGGCGGIDSALIAVSDLNIFTIEFKEPYAKTSEPDLPKYGENGILLITDDFKQRYPQFTSMLEEHNELCFFDVMGSNIHNFSLESINIAVSNNYTKKFADVICTEDAKGYLTMMPSNQVSLWGQIEGEIRPAGRNHYAVWTPEALRGFLENLGATITGNTVSVSKSRLDMRKGRGSGGAITGYKINPLFFVYVDDCYEQGGGLVQFDISKVQQLNPTIAAKVNFKSILKYTEVLKHYQSML